MLHNIYVLRQLFFVGFKKYSISYQFVLSSVFKCYWYWYCYLVAIKLGCLVAISASAGLKRICLLIPEFSTAFFLIIPLQNNCLPVDKIVQQYKTEQTKKIFWSPLKPNIKINNLCSRNQLISFPVRSR